MSHRQVRPRESREWEIRTGNGPVRATSPVPRETWARVLAADPGAMVFHLPEWLDCLCAVGGWKDAGRLYRTGDGRELVLPMVCRPARPHLLAVRASLPPAGAREAFWRPEGCGPRRSTSFLPTSSPIGRCAPDSVPPSTPHMRGRARRRDSSPCRAPCMFSTLTAVWTPYGPSDGLQTREGTCASRNAGPRRPG